MTRKDLLERLFPEIDLHDDSCIVLKCTPNGCNECKYNNYWDEPAVISKFQIKSILNCVYGAQVYFDTDSLKIVHDANNNAKTHAQHLLLIQQGWTKFPSLHNNIEWSMLKGIIDDALDNGFEVKILNGTIYYKEKE